jgi:hypothetical protein
MELDGAPVLLGDCEIRVLGQTGQIYAAPSLLAHYMAGARLPSPGGLPARAASRPDKLTVLQPGPPHDIMSDMTSWRDTASPQSQDDLDGLLNVTLPFAQQMLATSGEFYPFGAEVTTAGETRLLAGDLTQGEHPASVEVLSTLLAGLRQTRTDVRAVAICSDVRLTDSDAVRVDLEHREGHALAVLMPYKRKRFGRGVEYGELRAGAADRQIWT